LAAAFPELAIGFAGVALAFGLTVLVMAFAVGHISGGHLTRRAAPLWRSSRGLGVGTAVDVLVVTDYRCRDWWCDLPLCTGKSRVTSPYFCGSAAADPHFPPQATSRLTSR